MPALLFPSDDVLRLALAAGVIPADTAAAPVSGGFDNSGRVWVDAPAELVRDAFPALQRFGVRAHNPPEAPAPFLCWHHLLPLRPAAAVAGPFLIELPDHRVAAFAARVTRLDPQTVELRPLPRGNSGHCWLRVRRLPPSLIDPVEGTRCYSGAALRVWVRSGWEHPLADAIRPPDGVAFLLDPARDWRAVPEDVFFRSPPEYRIATTVVPSGLRTPPESHALGGHANPTRIVVTVALHRRRDPADEQFWIIPAGEPWERFLAESDERTLRGYRAATVADVNGQRRIVLRPYRERGAGFPPLSATGYTAHPGVPGLLVPITHTMTPMARRDRLAAALSLGDGGLVWLDPGAAGGFLANCAAKVRFHPAAGFVSYTAPTVTRLGSAWGADNAFAFDAIGSVPDPEPSVDRVGTARTGRANAGGRGRRPEPSWLARSLDRLAQSLRRKRAAHGAGRELPPLPGRGDPEADPTGGTDPQSLNELTARRAELEDRLIHRLPGLPGPERAVLWSEAAELAAATGEHADAGLCWANAVWEADDPPPAWFDGWLRAELRAAKVAHRPDDLGDWLTLTTRRVPPRLVAAYLAWCGSRSVPPSDLPVRLPRLVPLLEDRHDKLALRAAWLARTAAAGLAGGDPLGLARWRDATFRRLADTGPSLDLDAPGFVRFHGRPGGDRFRDARDWLLRMRDPAHRWLARQATSRRLQYFGLDPETDATAGYLDLMFAWGAGRLGERNAARHWEEAAAGVLGRPSGAADAGVHAVLLSAFRHRLRESQQGRPERPGLPADALGLPAYAHLTVIQRYAVDKLRRASGILEPVDRVDPYRGRDSADVLGADALGRRLRRLGELPPGDELDREVRSLLAVASSDPAAGTLPRVVLAAVSVAPRLPADTALGVLGRVPEAVRLTPEWVWAARDRATAPRGRLEECLAGFLDAAAHSAVVFDAADVVRELCRLLTGPVAPPAPIPQAVIGPIAGRFFRALRRLGLTAEAGSLLARVAPATDDPAARVGFAVGYLAVGDADVAIRLLDEARDRLFGLGSAPPRVRARLAVAYAAALGHAPPRMALGRLEEILQRLDGAAAHGSANRYFTVSFLELIDAVVRSVVSDDFALGPEIRGWLDDHEFGTRRRITRDLDAVLTAAGLAADIPGAGPTR